MKVEYSLPVVVKTSVAVVVSSSVTVVAIVVVVIVVTKWSSKIKGSVLLEHHYKDINAKKWL